jgi:hypothetical protein
MANGPLTFLTCCFLRQPGRADWVSESARLLHWDVTGWSCTYESSTLQAKDVMHASGHSGSPVCIDQMTKPKLLVLGLIVEATCSWTDFKRFKRPLFFHEQSWNNHAPLENSGFARVVKR